MSMIKLFSENAVCLPFQAVDSHLTDEVMPKVIEWPLLLEQMDLEKNYPTNVPLIVSDCNPWHDS